MIVYSNNKYHNIPTKTADGILHDSRKEARRWCELKLLEKAGKITDLERQVKFELIPAQYETYERYGKDGKRLKDGRRRVELSVDYVADFVYTKDGKQVVEDVKGYKDGAAYKIFVIKRKLMLCLKGIKILET
jgi:hypothetical protein